MGAMLLRFHQPLPLPQPPPLSASGRWRLLHALDMSCPCSKRIYEYLLERRATRDAEERVLLVRGDAHEEAELLGRGFAVARIDGEELQSRYGIVAVPSLVVHRPDGSVAYRGAHRPRPHLAPADLGILARARSGQAVAPLPVLGCAVSRALREQLDPLGLKY